MFKNHNDRMTRNPHKTHTEKKQEDGTHLLGP